MASIEENGHMDHAHEHHGNFITNYIFSTDHKVIAKQYLITGIVWALIGGGLSLIFRLQLGFPNAQLEWLRVITSYSIHYTKLYDNVC